MPVTDKDNPEDQRVEPSDGSVDVPHSVLTDGERLILMFLVGPIGAWSAMSGPIYFPALPDLSRVFEVSEGVMNWSVVTYLVLQGLAPAVSSTLADRYGKRPVLLASLAIFIASCIGISQTNAFWLLLLLRCIQSASIAPAIAVGSGISGDVCTAAQRGRFVGIVSGMFLCGNAFGGILGAGLVAGFGWRGIFVFLAIGGAVTLLACVLMLPETNRLVVGNGSVKPRNIACTFPLIGLPRFRDRLTNDVSTLTPKEPLDFTSAIRIIVKPAVLCNVVPVGLAYTGWIMSLTSISIELEGPRYNYSIVHVGLIYLPQGIACMLASFVAGEMLNRYYAYRKKAYDQTYANHPDPPRFNKLRVRLDLCLAPGALVVIGLLIFGWCLEYHSHIISIIIATCLISFSVSLLMTCVTTMLVDLFPTKSSTSSSCINLIRCILAAVGIALLSRMTASLTIGGTYTLMAGLVLFFQIILVFYIWHASKHLLHPLPREHSE